VYRSLELLYGPQHWETDISPLDESPRTEALPPGKSPTDISLYKICLGRKKPPWKIVYL